jgi:hypothetical protein
MSHAYVDNQYAIGLTPATVCKCFAFDSRSETTNTANEAEMKGNDRTNKNQAEKESSAKL